MAAASYSSICSENCKEHINKQANNTRACDRALIIRVVDELNKLAIICNFVIRLALVGRNFSFHTSKQPTNSMTTPKDHTNSSAAMSEYLVHNLL